MALPENQLSDVPAWGPFLHPDGRLRPSLLVDYELGGIAIGDPSEGLEVQVWEARVSGDEIQARPESGGDWTAITSDSGITEIALSFDQNMRPTVSFVAGGMAKMYWYDAQVASYTTTSFPGAASPVVTMDDKRESQVGLNDVLLFYLRGGRVLHRRQRDRYSIEYDLAAVPAGMTRILRWGMTEALRVQLEFGIDAEPEEPAEDVFGTMYADLRTDTLYVVDGPSIVPFFLGAQARLGRWRSPKFVLSSQPTVAWLRVNGPMAGSVTVRVFGDGALLSEQTIAARSPVRMPAVRARLWEIEVESIHRVTGVTLASSVQELRSP